MTVCCNSCALPSQVCFPRVSPSIRLIAFADVREILEESSDEDDLKKKERGDAKFLTLYTYNEIPPWLQFNNYIFSGYRKNLSFANCLKSLFRFHNEVREQAQCGIVH